jgi:hypothetical protein
MTGFSNTTNPRGFALAQPCTRKEATMSTKHTTTTRRAFLASVPVAAATLTPAAAATLSGLAPSGAIWRRRIASAV